MQLVVRQQSTGSNDKAELKVNSSIFSDSDALGEEGNNQALSLFSLFLLSHKPDLSSKLIKLDFDESFIQNLSAHSREWRQHIKRENTYKLLSLTLITTN